MAVTVRHLEVGVEKKIARGGCSNHYAMKPFMVGRSIGSSIKIPC